MIRTPQVRAGKDEARRIRGQLEATGMSDSEVMGLLRGRDAALAAAAARVSALEASQVCVRWPLPPRVKWSPTEPYTVFAQMMHLQYSSKII